MCTYGRVPEMARGYDVANIQENSADDLPASRLGRTSLMGTSGRLVMEV